MPNRNRGNRIEQQRRRARTAREMIQKIKAGPCKDCGGTFHHAAMDFDHVIGEKKFEVSKMVLRSLQSILDEIAKCDLVCACCHRVRTYRRLFPGTIEAENFSAC
jgi:hypothetical protein